LSGRLAIRFDPGTSLMTRLLPPAPGLIGNCGLSATKSLLLCVIVPARNEVDNVRPLLTRLAPVLGAVCEVLFVDNSSDETPDRPGRPAAPPGAFGLAVLLLRSAATGPRQASASRAAVRKVPVLVQEPDHAAAHAGAGGFGWPVAGFIPDHDLAGVGFVLTD
jgi:hypothetical protein